MIARRKPMARPRAGAAAQRRPSLKRGGRITPRTPSPLWLAAKAVVLARAKGACEFCKAAGPLDVHHVIKRSHFGKKNVALAHCPISNLIALCRECHDATDAPYTAGRLVIIHVVVKGIHGYDCELLRAESRAEYRHGRYETIAWNHVRSEAA